MANPPERRGVTPAMRPLVPFLIHVGLGVLVVAPFILIGSFSLQSDLDVMQQSGFQIWPATPSLENYMTLFEQRGNFPKALNNSLVISACLAVVVALSCLWICWFLVSADNLKETKKTIGFLFLSARFIPPIVTFPAFSFLTTELGLSDTYYAILMALFVGAVGFGMLILSPAVGIIPRSEVELHRLEGFTPLHMIQYTVIPRLASFIAIIFIITFVVTWNEFILTNLLTYTSRSQPVSVVIAGAIGQFRISYGTIAAGAVISIAPVLLGIVAFELVRRIPRYSE